MNIGINGLLMSGAKTGIGNYMHNLLKALAKVDTTNSYKIFTAAQGEIQDCFAGNQLPIAVKLPGKGSWARILWEQTMLPHQMDAHQIDLMHFADYALPVLYKTRPWIISVHDLAYRIYPETFSRGKLWTKLALVKPSLHKAAKIITGSENTKQDIMKFYGIPPEQIAVTTYGVDLERFNPLSVSQVQTGLERYGLEPGYILFIGTLEPRKNIISVIRAYHHLRSNGCQQKLVIGGGNGWLYSDIFKQVEELKLVEDIIFTGYLPDADLPLLYNGAGVFVYPSLYEGFGLPPLEAMACGTPVVTSNVSSLPEVVGTAGLMVPPLDAMAIAEAIGRVLTDHQFADQLSIQGIQRAQDFSWEKTALQTLAVYQEVLASNNK